MKIQSSMPYRYPMLESLLLAICLGFAGGTLFWVLNAPAPFMMGALFSCWVLGAVIPFRRIIAVKPAIPIEFRRFVLSFTGVLLGSYLTPDTTSDTLLWWDTILAVIVFTFVSTGISFVYLVHLRGKNPLVAWLSSLPGGLSEIVMLSRRYTDQDYVVAIYHLMRVTLVFILVPIILALSDPELASQQGAAPGQFHLNDIGLSWVARMVILVGGGALIAHLAKLPMGAMLIPLCLSAAYHLAGFPPLERVFELIILVQVVLGSGIGLSLADVRLATLRPHFFDALMSTVIILSVVVALSWGYSELRDEQFLKYFLIFVPGGINELALLSLVFGYEVAFVTVHHAVRILSILAASPLSVRFQVKKTGRKGASSAGDCPPD